MENLTTWKIIEEIDGYCVELPNGRRIYYVDHGGYETEYMDFETASLIVTTMNNKSKEKN